ncbi:MAG: hypothetical protein IK080_03280 [Clostridia bacterium]|nr:hypothetical protein [Clostridia bacterium]
MAKKRKKNQAAFPLGLLAAVLAVIGLATVISYAVNGVKRLTDQTALKREYEEFLKPVVMFDPDPFDDLTQADVPQLLNSAVWALLMSTDGTEQYSYSQGETFGIIVPQADIEKYFVKLFGTEIDIASMHASLDMSKYEITYDAALKSYILPVTGVESAYTPHVTEIDKQGSSVILTVGYIGSRAWAQIEDGVYTAPEPDKYMKITLRERSGGMYVASIQATDGQEVVPVTTRAEESGTVSQVKETTTKPQETTELTYTEYTGVTDANGQPLTLIADQTYAAVNPYATYNYDDDDEDDNNNYNRNNYDDDDSGSDNSGNDGGYGEEEETAAVYTEENN